MIPQTLLEIFGKVNARARRGEYISSTVQIKKFNSCLYTFVLEEREKELKYWLDMAMNFRSTCGSCTYFIKDGKLIIEEKPLPKLLQDKIDEIGEKWISIYNQLVISE